MQPSIPALIYSVLLFAGMMILLEAGRRMGIRRPAGETDADRGGLGTIEGALFALFGLILTFTFSGAAIRFNEKRMKIADEANAIGTAYLRLILLAADAQPEVQELVRQYTDSRLATYQKLPDWQSAQEELAKTNKIQNEIWTRVVVATHSPGAHPDAGLLLLTPLERHV